MGGKKKTMMMLMMEGSVEQRRTNHGKTKRLTILSGKHGGRGTQEEEDGSG
jgi:hypothetical protein